MVEKEKLKKMSMLLTANRNDYMSAFRHNIDMYIEEKDITLRELSELAEIPYSTLNTFVYGQSKDCNLSTAVKLARALEISVDELIGAETMDSLSKESLAICRNLPEHFVYLIRAYIRHIYKLFVKVDPSEYHIPVILPECHNGHLQTTNINDVINIHHLNKTTRSRVAYGLKIPCEHYEPYYMPGEIVLLAVDRDGMNNEKCVISHDGNIYIVIKKIYMEDNVKKVKYVSLLDQKNEFLRDEIDDKLGYVVGYLNPDGTWGIR